MPYKVVGRKVINKRTGKVVAVARSKRNAHIIASIKERYHRKKHK